MKEIYKDIDKYIKPEDKVALEAAHIYMDQKPTEEQKNGASIGYELAQCFPRSRKLLMIDDLNVTSQSLDTAQYLEWLKGFGFSPDEVFMESNLVDSGISLLQRIKETVKKKKLAIKTPLAGSEAQPIGLRTALGRVPLITEKGRLSCALLDAAFYLRKAQTTYVSLTILPESYAPQQQATFEVLKAAGEHLRIVNVFFDPASKDRLTIRSNYGMEGS